MFLFSYDILQIGQGFNTQTSWLLIKFHC